MTETLDPLEIAHWELRSIERTLRRFQMTAGAGVTVEGEIRTGYAVNVIRRLAEPQAVAVINTITFSDISICFVCWPFLASGGTQWFRLISTGNGFTFALNQRSSTEYLARNTVIDTMNTYVVDDCGGSILTTLARGLDVFLFVQSGMWHIAYTMDTEGWMFYASLSSADLTSAILTSTPIPNQLTSCGSIPPVVTLPPIVPPFPFIVASRTLAYGGTALIT